MYPDKVGAYLIGICRELMAAKSTFAPIRPPHQSFAHPHASLGSTPRAWHPRAYAPTRAAPPPGAALQPHALPLLPLRVSIRPSDAPRNPRSPSPPSSERERAARGYARSASTAGCLCSTRPPQHPPRTKTKRHKRSPFRARLDREVGESLAGAHLRHGTMKW